MVSLDPERTPAVYPVFAWLEIAAQLEVLGDGALAAAIIAAMSGGGWEIMPSSI